MNFIIFYGLLVLTAVVLAFAIFGAPRFIDNWVIRQIWDVEGAMKALVKMQAKGKLAQDEFDAAYERINEIYGDAMARVERHIRLHDSIDARRARVARRRPLQRKLGRIA